MHALICQLLTGCILVCSLTSPFSGSAGEAEWLDTLAIGKRSEDLEVLMPQLLADLEQLLQSLEAGHTQVPYQCTHLASLPLDA